MKTKVALISTLLVLIITTFGFGEVKVYDYQYTNRPDLYDLDHYSSVKWGIDISNIARESESIIGATLFFDDIHNHTYGEENDLYVTALNASEGLDTEYDGQAYGNQFAGDGELLFHWQDLDRYAYSVQPRDIAITLTNDTYKDTLLEDSFFDNLYFEASTYDQDGTNGGDETLYDGVNDGGVILVENDALQNLLYYLQGNILGLGFDADCHFYNAGVTLKLWTVEKTSDVPEPATFLLFGFGLLGFASRLRKRNQS